MGGSLGGSAATNTTDALLPSNPGGSAAPPLTAEALVTAATASPLKANLGTVRVGLPAPAHGTDSPEPTTGGRGAVDMAEDVPEDVGASGEYFVFLQLRSMLPNFVRANWVSKLKLHFLPGSEDIKNDVGADFIYQDMAGLLTGSGKGEVLYIEVKSLTQEAVGPVRLSIGEWERAKCCHESSGREVYVLAVVTSVTRAPRLAALIIDPVQQVSNGAATCEISELVYTAV